MITNLILILKAIILGVVEGFNEFLPISSTGHMIIIGHFLNFQGDFAKFFEIFIQLGAILAVIVLFRKMIFDSLKSLKPNGFGFKLWTNLIIAFIPAGIIGFLFHEKIEEYLMIPISVAVALLIGGLWMIYAEKNIEKLIKLNHLSKLAISKLL
jgi:undecaprenyl-diphosphatase